MIAAFSTPARRISFAIVLSVIVHAAVLWLPYLQRPHDEIRLPPLSVRLEHLPKATAVQPTAKPEPLTNASKTDNSLLAKPAANAVATMKEMEKSAATHQFPKHVQITFDIYRGESFFKAGELFHQLDIHLDEYTLKATKRIAGPASLQGKDQSTQASHGKINAQGLRPDIFEEKKIVSQGEHGSKATFDWDTQKLHLSHGDGAELPDDTQDILSFMYQLSKLPMNREVIPLSISDGEELKKYQIEIVGEEDIDTPMGKLSALHLREMHPQEDAYFEIWLGLEYRLLPVKFRQIDGSGTIIEEFVISDIRASEK